MWTRILILSVSAAVFATDSARAQTQESKNAARVLTLCELVSNAAHYNRHMVAVRAIYSEGPESSDLSDANCGQAGKELTHVEFAQGAARKSPRTLRRLQKLLKKQGRALVVFEGTFYGPEALRVDPNLPAPIKEKLQKGKKRYGHMDSRDFMIEVTSIKLVEQAPAEVTR